MSTLNNQRIKLDTQALIEHSKRYTDFNFFDEICIYTAGRTIFNYTGKILNENDISTKEYYPALGLLAIERRIHSHNIEREDHSYDECVLGMNGVVVLPPVRRSHKNFSSITGELLKTINVFEEAECIVVFCREFRSGILTAKVYDVIGNERFIIDNISQTQLNNAVIDTVFGNLAVVKIDANLPEPKSYISIVSPVSGKEVARSKGFFSSECQSTSFFKKCKGHFKIFSFIKGKGNMTLYTPECLEILSFDLDSHSGFFNERFSFAEFETCDGIVLAAKAKDTNYWTIYSTKTGKKLSSKKYKSLEVKDGKLIGETIPLPAEEILVT